MTQRDGKVLQAAEHYASGSRQCDPLVSVIVAAYQPANFKALRSSMAANSEAFVEWIVVDDGSGPDFDSVFGGLSDASVGVFRHAQNQGQASARNIGLMHAKGAWIKFLDADDCLDVGHLSTLLSVGMASPEGAVPFAPTLHVMEDGATWVNDSWIGLPRDSEAQLARLLHRPFLSHCGALFRRGFLMELKGYDESLVTDEDGDLLIRVLLAGKHFVGVPQVQYHYMHHAGAERVSVNAGSEKLDSRLRVCDRLEAAFVAIGKPMPDAVRRGLALRLDRIALFWWSENRTGARAALERAGRVCPVYRRQLGLVVRILRLIGGPGAELGATRIYRRLRRHPAG